MRAVVTKAFHYRRTRYAPSGDLAAPNVVDLDPVAFERFSSLGCVVAASEYATKSEAEAEAATFVAEATKMAAEVGARELEDAKASSTSHHVIDAPSAPKRPRRKESPSSS